MLQAFSTRYAQPMFGARRVLEPSSRRVATGSMQCDTVQFSGQRQDDALIPAPVPKAGESVDVQAAAIIDALRPMSLQDTVDFNTNVHVFCANPQLFDRVVDGVYQNDFPVANDLQGALPPYVSLKELNGFSTLRGLYGLNEAQRRAEYVTKKALASSSPDVYDLGRKSVDYLMMSLYQQQALTPDFLAATVQQLLEQDTTLPAAVRAQGVPRGSVTPGDNPRYNAGFVVNRLMRYMYYKGMPNAVALDPAKAALARAVEASGDTLLQRKYRANVASLTAEEP